MYIYIYRERERDPARLVLPAEALVLLAHLPLELVDGGLLLLPPARSLAVKTGNPLL